MTAATAVREIGADDFVALVKLLKRGPTVPVAVIGGVSFAAWKCDRNINFEGVEFTGDFVAPNADLQGLTFENCTFAAKFDCSNSILAGDLALLECRFAEPRGKEEEPRIRLDCAEIGGKVHITLAAGLSARNMVISGDLFLAPPRLPGPSVVSMVQLDHAQIRGAIEINTPRSRPRSLGEVNRLRVAQLMSLSGTTCAKLEMAATDVSGRLDFSGLKSSGAVILTGVAAGYVEGFGCSVGLNFYMSAPWSGHEVETTSIDLSSAQVAGHIQIGGGGRPNPFPADQPRLTLSDELSLRGAKCAVLVVQETDVAGRIDISGLQAGAALLIDIAADSVYGHSCNLGRLQLRDLVPAQKPAVRIAREFSLWSASVREQLDIASAAYIRRLRLGDCVIGSFWIGSEPTYLGTEPPADAEPSVLLGGLDAFDSRFESFVRMSRLRVVCDPAEDGETNGSIDFKNCHFGSEFGTWAPRRPAYSLSREDRLHIDGWEDDNQVEIERDFAMTGCQAERFVDLTRLKTGVASPALGGAIRLDGTTIRDELRFASPISVLYRRGLSHEATAAALAEWTRVRDDPARTAITKAHARSLSMVDARAGSIDLSGLTLVGPVGEAGGPEGRIDAQRIAVRGAVSLYAHIDQGAEERDEIRDGVTFAYAVVPGALRLDGAQIGELRVTAHSFRDEPPSGEAGSPGPANRQAHTHGLVLEAADIGLLRVPQLAGLCQPSDAGCSAFPVPLDLAGLSVRHWFFTEEETGDPCKEADRYLDFLDNDESLHRDVYHAVAETLRNLGEDEQAERVLFTSHYRANAPSDWQSQRGTGRLRPVLGMGWIRTLRLASRTEPGASSAHRGVSGAPRRLFQWLDRILLRYRRNPISLLGIAFLLYLLSVPVAIDPRNFELSNGGRTSAMLECALGVGGRDTDFIAADGGSMPTPSSWSVGDALWMALRYHIPVIALTARSDFEASDNEPLHYGLRRYSPNEKLLDRMTEGRCTGAADGSGAEPIPRHILVKAPAAPGPPPKGPPAPVRTVAAGVTAEDWFGIMAILNWILWPLLLTFLLRTLLRSQ